jgi:hypothetical protein
MFRYGSFDDEPRRGVLAMDAVAPEIIVLSGANENWSTEIQNALNLAISDAFGNTSDDAIDRLQESFRGLASEGSLPQESADKLREFLDTFQSNLA